MFIVSGCGVSSHHEKATKAVEKGEKNQKKSQNKIIAYYVQLNHQVRECKEQIIATLKQLKSEAPQHYSQLETKMKLFSDQQELTNLEESSLSSEDLITLRELLVEFASYLKTSKKTINLLKLKI